MLKNTVWENVVYTTITFLLNFSLVFQDIWNGLMKHRRLYICIGPVSDLLWPKTFGNRPGIFTSVLIAMEYFVRRQKSTFDLENEKCICQGNFFVSHVIRSTYSGLMLIIFELCMYETLEGICIRFNNFAKSVIF